MKRKKSIPVQSSVVAGNQVLIVVPIPAQQTITSEITGQARY